MDGATVGEKCTLTECVVGKKAKIGARAVLSGCEVQDGNVVGEGVEGKGEKFLVGGLEDSDEVDDDDGADGVDELDERNEEDSGEEEKGV